MRGAGAFEPRMKKALTKMRAFTDYFEIKPKERFELSTPALRKRCSAIELLRRFRQRPDERAERILAPAGRFQGARLPADAEHCYALNRTRFGR